MSPPTREQVETYCKFRNNNVDVDKFMVYYEDCEPPWSVATRKQGVRKPMTSWRSSIITWEQNMSASHSISSIKQRTEDYAAKKKVYTLPPKKKVTNPKILALNNEMRALENSRRDAPRSLRIHINGKQRDIRRQILVIKDEDMRLKL